MIFLELSLETKVQVLSLDFRHGQIEKYLVLGIFFCFDSLHSIPILVSRLEMLIACIFAEGGGCKKFLWACQISYLRGCSKIFQYRINSKSSYLLHCRDNLFLT